MSELSLPEIPQRGSYYWKLNVSILKDKEVEDNFKREWIRICTNKFKFKDLNEWWDMYAKKTNKIIFYQGRKVNK